ncbi:MAG: septum formation initiator family protein [Dysgonamonadaceae bacterium]|jgi:cell division protein FtsB|nr:septum formation initiator family protein [Dysgonamonadaceae bacterium]
MSWESIKSRFGWVNKYVVAIAIFALVMLFLGDKTVIDRIRYDREISRLESEVAVQKKNLQASRDKLEAIKKDDESLEKFAREQYRLTKPDEELFLIEE